MAMWHIDMPEVEVVQNVIELLLPSIEKVESTR